GDLGYLLVASLMKHLQGKDHPLVLIQLRQRVSNDTVELPVQKRSIGRQLVISNLDNAIVIDPNLILIPLLRPQRFAGDVLRYSKQPGRKLGLVAHGSQTLVSAHERLLGEFLRKVSPVHHIEDEADDWACVSFEDQAKSVVISSTGARNDLGGAVHHLPR